MPRPSDGFDKEEKKDGAKSQMAPGDSRNGGLPINAPGTSSASTPANPAASTTTAENDLLRKENETLEARIKELEGQITTFSKEIDKYTAESDAEKAKLEGKIRELQRLFDTRGKEVDQLRRELETEKLKAPVVPGNEQAKIDELTAEIATLKGTVQRRETELAAEKAKKPAPAAPVDPNDTEQSKAIVELFNQFTAEAEREAPTYQGSPNQLIATAGVLGVLIELLTPATRAARQPLVDKAERIAKQCAVRSIELQQLTIDTLLEFGVGMGYFAKTEVLAVRLHTVANAQHLRDKLDGLKLTEDDLKVKRQNMVLQVDLATDLLKAKEDNETFARKANADKINSLGTQVTSLTAEIERLKEENQELREELDQDEPADPKKFEFDHDPEIREAQEALLALDEERKSLLKSRRHDIRLKVWRDSADSMRRSIESLKDPSVVFDVPNANTQIQPYDWWGKIADFSNSPMKMGGAFLAFATFILIVLKGC